MPTRKARRVSAARAGVDAEERMATSAANSSAAAETRHCGSPLPDPAMRKNIRGFKVLLCHRCIALTSSMALPEGLVAQGSRHPKTDFRPPLARQLPVPLGGAQILGLGRP